MLRKIHVLGLGAVLGLAGASVALAGGFWISFYSGKAPVAANVKDAVLVVAAEGCHQPADASIAGAAEGLVNGKRQSIPLKFTKTSKPGVYAVTRQWPAEGVWVLAITGKYLNVPSSAIVEVLPNGQGKVPAKASRQQVSPAEIDAALRELAAKRTT